MKPLLAFTLGANHPSGRMRIAAYAEAWQRLGWQLRLHPFDPGMGKSPARSEAAWMRMQRRLQRGWQTLQAKRVLRHFPAATPMIISRELPVSRQPFLKASNPMVLDVDDALYLGSGRGPLAELCGRANVVVCGNETIAEKLQPLSRRCVVIPTVVDCLRYKVRNDQASTGRLRIGWVGSSMSCDQALLPFMTVLGEIHRRLPFELVIISDEPPGWLASISWARFLKWSPAVETAIADHFDIGIMPLEDTAYQTAKCGAKLLQYMAAGLPVIATPLGVNRSLVRDGQTGFWADTPEDWGVKIQRLAGQSDLRVEFGRAGREHVQKNYSVTRWAGVWSDVLSEVTAGDR